MAKKMWSQEMAFFPAPLTGLIGTFAGADPASGTPLDERLLSRFTVTSSKAALYPAFETAGIGPGQMRFSVRTPR